MSKRSLPRVLIELVVLVIFLLHVSSAVRLPLIGYIENFIYDARITLTMPDTVEESLVIADIDEKSLAALGRWPWSRNVVADLMDALFDHYQIKVIGFDMVFAEKDASSGIGVLSELAKGEFKNNDQFQRAYKRLATELEYDQQFAESLKNRNTVMGFVFDQQDLSVNSLPPNLGEFDADLVSRFNIPQPNGYVSNQDMFTQNALSSGFFDNPSLDEDGIFRRVPIVQAYQGQLFPSLALETARVAMGYPEINFGLMETGAGFLIQDFRLGDQLIPIDSFGNVLVPYRGRAGSFPYISIIDIIEKNIPKESLTGKTVLLGASAAGLLDLRSTPVGGAYPGVEVHANITSGIINNELKVLPDYTLGLEVISMLILGIGMMVLQPRLGPGGNVMLLVGGIVSMVALNLYFWNIGYAMPLTSEILIMIWMFLVHMSYGYFFEFRGKQQITKQFGQYVPPEIVGELSDNPDEVNFEGQAKELTVFFSDVRGFTSISEGLDARELADLMNQYLTPMTEIIHNKRGTIDKYMGDAIMAFWGAPVEEPNHALLAVEASMDMLERLRSINEEFQARGWPEVKIGIGLNTGTMSVGNMGSDFRMAYTVMGDSVNLGARLESLTKQYGVSMMVSEYTAEAVPEYAYIELDRVVVKGKVEPVTVYQPLCRKEDLNEGQKSLLSDYEKAMNAYRAQDWSLAKTLLAKLLERESDRLIYQIYLDRIAVFEKDPPPKDWDGVFIHTSK